ncbi:MAG: CvfB family protein [bacterium]
MINVGQSNRMTVTKTVDFGVYLDGEDLGEILLPKRYCPEGITPGDELEVFLYLDSDDRLIATTETPKARVGECAALKVTEVNRIGAFLDWGLPKELLVPYSEQAIPMKAGNTYVVYLFVDENSGRITASSKLENFLPDTSIYHKTQQPVELLVHSRTDLGYKVVVDGSHLGLLYKNEVFQPINIGQTLQGYIKSIRDDHKLDLSLQLPNAQVSGRDQLKQEILNELQAAGGQSSLTDKSPPEEIYARYKVSKGSYKKALGALYKEKKILIQPGMITLNQTLNHKP